MLKSLNSLLQYDVKVYRDDESIEDKEMREELTIREYAAQMSIRGFQRLRESEGDENSSRLGVYPKSVVNGTKWEARITNMNIKVC